MHRTQHLCKLPWNHKSPNVFSPNSWHCFIFRDYFYQFGELRSISIVPRQNCAFVCFSSRASAEVAAERSFNKLVLKGRRLKIMWGKSQGQQPTPGKQGGAPLVPVPGLPGGEMSISPDFVIQVEPPSTGRPWGQEKCPHDGGVLWIEAPACQPYLAGHFHLILPLLLIKFFCVNGLTSNGPIEHPFLSSESHPTRVTGLDAWIFGWK